MDYKTFTELEILERVDEYTLYCHYLGYEVEIGGSYPVPDSIRATNKMAIDEHNSFGVFVRKYGGEMPHDLLWKDQGAGFTGDIFELVRRMFNYSIRYEAMQRILSDFGLGADPSPHPLLLSPIPKKYAVPIEISVVSKPWTMRERLYWDRYNVTPKISEAYHTTVLNHYWMTATQKRPIKAKGMGFAYRIFNKYQLYFPYAPREDKFRNDWDELCVPGFEQLQGDQSLLIITKAMKDVKCLRSFGIESIAPRGENILLPEACLKSIDKRYKRILILFDNDMKHKGNEYKYDKIYVPKILDTDKDPSDYCDNHGEHETRKMLKSIIYGY